MNQTRHLIYSSFSSCIVLVLAMTSATSVAEDWPKWNGPRQDGSIVESNLVRSIPTGGLKQKWSASIGLGYAGPVVAEGHVIVTDYVKREGERTNNPGTRDHFSGREGVHAFDQKTGEKLWSYEYDREYAISYPSGPRAVPTIDDGDVYALGSEGDLLSIDLKSGKLQWTVQLRDQYMTETPIWGYSAHPFIYKDALITLAGGEGSLVVAFDKKSGKEKWRALTSPNIGYCMPSILNVGGEDQLIIWEPLALHGLEPETGKTIWSIPFAPNYDMSITPPIYNRDGDQMYLSGIGDLACLFAVDSKHAELPFKALWKGRSKHALYCSNSTPVFDGDYIYGADCQVGSMICIQASDGKRLWESFEPTSGGDRRASHGTAFFSKTGDLYYLLSETGDFIIAKLSPQGYQEIGRQRVLNPTNETFGREVVWSYPAYSDKTLFARNDEKIVAYDLAE